MFSRLLTSALFAGAAAGLCAALLQLFFVQPILLHAELYETGTLVHFGSESVVSAHQALPGFEPMRDGLSIFFTMLVYSGYALLTVGAMELAAQRGHTIDGRTGLLWGFAGFLAFHFAPGFSLAPEVPGVAAADVQIRQLWWLATVVTAISGIGLIAFGTTWKAWAPAVVLLLAPHVIGAPQPEVYTGPVPTELGAEFAARAFGVGLAAWVMLGSFAGFFWKRETARAQSLANA
ncbi:CbtA family protein [Roseibium sp. CAU 1637]|uniref:CbtA family protein n=1 Tax=Roseibium limicola TaxID=2816037 RepID=A0A939ENQ1_9HYPH|nr:CbtA family protein [Roseibium limicola]MBO0345257.1 CbtA family protein [Roseibium limicola]